MSQLADQTDPRVVEVVRKALDLLENEIDSYWDMEFYDDAALVQAKHRLHEIASGNCG